MSTHQYSPMHRWLRCLAIILLLAMLMPSASVFAQTPSPTLRKNSASRSNLTPLAEEDFSWNLDPELPLANLSADLLQDGGFEAYAAYGDNPYWVENDSEFNTPLCTGDNCDYWVDAHPYNGDDWAWFGGASVPLHTASLAQSVAFPACGSGVLRFYLWIGYVQPGGGADDVFYAKIDGTPVFSANATQSYLYPSYTQVDIALSSNLADGGYHTIEFSHQNTYQDIGFHLDDVSLIWTYCSTIYGYVGTSGVALSYTAGTPQTVFTDFSGGYLLRVPFGWSGTVTPSKAGYVFSPASRTYVNVQTDLFDQNYAPLHTISGTTGIGDVTLSYAGALASGTATSQADGTYSFNVPENWGGTVTASHPCFAFTPPTISYSNVLNHQTNKNYTPGSIDPACADIDVSIGGSKRGDFGLPVSGSTRASFTNVDSGPAQILSNNNIPLIASQRINLKNGTGFESYTEFLGLPASKLSDTYIFPWYNNATAGGLSSQLRFANVGNATTTITIKIAGVADSQTYTLDPNESARVSLTDVDNGPVEVKSSGGVPIIASMRINLKNGVGFDSYTEFLGLSASSTASTKYIFPWYNNATAGGLNSQLRFANVGNAITTVTIKVSGVTQPDTYTLDPNESARVSLANVDSGPVEVISSGNVPIIAAMRANLKNNTGFESYSEFIGLPGATLSETRYLFPWYNNATNGGLSSQIRIGNVGNATTTVTIKIAGVAQPTTYTLGASESARVTLTNVDSGPVEVISSDNVPIIASMRVNLKSGLGFESYSEFIGLSVGSPVGFPGNELSTTYWFPWYNNATNGGLSSQLRFGVP